MKTLVLFEEVPVKSFFFVLEGDYRHLNNVYINAGHNEEKAAELNALVYTSEGVVKVDELDEPIKDWDYFIKCGFIL